MLPVAGDTVKQGGNLLLPLRDGLRADEEKSPGNPVVGHDNCLLVPECCFTQLFQVIVRRYENHLCVLIHIRGRQQCGALVTAFIIRDKL